MKIDKMIEQLEKDVKKYHNEVMIGVIDRFVASLTTKQTIDLNIESASKHLESFEKYGKDIYPNPKRFTLEEFKYFKELLLKKKKELAF